jgi:hypothetical protein
LKLGAGVQKDLGGILDLANVETLDGAFSAESALKAPW